MLDLIGKLKLQTNLSNNEKQLANYILKHLDDIVLMNAEELAEVSNASLSCIYRLCKKMKINGFAQFKTQLASESNIELSKYKEIDFSMPFSKEDTTFSLTQNMANLYKQTIDKTISTLNFHELETIAKAILNSDNVFFLTTSFNVAIAETFARHLNELGIHIHIAAETSQRRLLCSLSKKDDVVILLSYSGSSYFIQDCLQQLYHNQANIIIVSSNKNEKLHRYATHHLLLCSEEDETNKIATFSSYLSAQFIFDLLFSLLYQHNFEWNFSYRTKKYMIDK